MRIFKFVLLVLAVPIGLYPGLYVTWIGGVTVVEESLLRWQLRGVQAWPTTEAKVEWAESRKPGTWYPWPSRVHCRFHYTWKGRPYAVEQNRFSARHSFFSVTHETVRARLASSLPPFDHKRCHVNPDQPGEAFLTETFDDAQLGVILAAACFALLLGLGMLSVGVLLIWALWLWATGRGEEKPPPPPPLRLEPTVNNGRILLPLAAWFSVGAIPMAGLTLPALLRGAADGSYWVPVALQFALPVPCWWLGLRRWRSAPLVKDSWLALDGRPITMALPPSGRLFLAPTTDLPDVLSVKVELIRSAGKHSSTLWKRRFNTPREMSSDGLGGACYTISAADGPIPIPEAHRYYRLLWAISVRGRTRGRRFSMFFSRFL